LRKESALTIRDNVKAKRLVREGIPKSLRASVYK
jgi:hypothetical protein